MKKSLARRLLVIACACLGSLVWAEDLPGTITPTTDKDSGHPNTTLEKPGSTYQLIDIAKELGLSGNTPTWSAEVADFNADQRPDILLVRHKPAPERLYLNTHNGFKPSDFGLAADRHHCVAADVNLDGRMDSFCSVGARRGTGTGENNLYLQQMNGSFEDAAQAYGVVDLYGRGRWATFLNANGDAYPDLFVGNSPTRADEHISSNRLFINDSGTSFKDAKDYGINLPISARCAITTDFDQDGLDDLLVCSWHGLKLYLNQRGEHFEDASHRIKGEREWDRAVLADLDNDGDADLVTVRANQLAIHYRRGDYFAAPEFTLALTTGVDVAAADADGDNDIDLFVVQSGCQVTEKKPTQRLASRDDFLLLNTDKENMQSRFQKISANHLRPAQGCAGQALAIDYDADGRSEFLILNGSTRSRGPLQLIQLK